MKFIIFSRINNSDNFENIGEIELTNELLRKNLKEDLEEKLFNFVKTNPKYFNASIDFIIFCSETKEALFRFNLVYPSDNNFKLIEDDEKLKPFLDHIEAFVMFEFINWYREAFNDPCFYGNERFKKVWHKELFSKKR